MKGVTYRYEFSSEALFEAAARSVAEGIKEALKDKDRAVLGLCGGRSAGGVCARLKSLEVPWKRVHIFMVDERIVPPESPERNFNLIEKSLTASLVRAGRLPAENVHPFVPRDRAEDFGAAEYTKELERYGGRYDVVFLSAGEDGHIASLFPGGSVLNDAPGHIPVPDSPKPPPRRMSVSRRLLLKTSWAVLLIAGEAKRKAYEALRDQGSDFARFPVVLVKELPHSIVVTDLGPERENRHLEKQLPK